MDPEKFTICNTPTWNKAFEELKAAASGVLAPGLKPHKVELRLYKLLVYEEGSFFLPHRDTQKTENHFGTVVLSFYFKDGWLCTRKLAWHNSRTFLSS